MNTAPEEVAHGCPGVTVRAARVGDLAEVLRVERSLATAVHWSVGEYERMVAPGGVVRRRLLVAEGAGKVGGFAVGMVAGDLGDLESVAVEAAWQRRGVGRALCRAVLDWCWAEGAANVELEVREGSVGARRVYAGLRFSEVGRRRGYYDAPLEDAVLMRVARRECTV